MKKKYISPSIEKMEFDFAERIANSGGDDGGGGGPCPRCGKIGCMCGMKKPIV